MKHITVEENMDGSGSNYAIDHTIATAFGYVKLTVFGWKATYLNSGNVVMFVKYATSIKKAKAWQRRTHNKLIKCNQLNNAYIN